MTTPPIKIILIPFDLDLKNNVHDRDVYKHAVETIKIFQKQKHCVHPIPIIYSHEFVFPFCEIFIVCHGTKSTIGNDADKQLSIKEIGILIQNIASQNIFHFYLFSCQSAFMLHEIAQHIKQEVYLYGINGYIGQVKGKKHIYVSENLGGHPRWRYEDRLKTYHHCLF